MIIEIPEKFYKKITRDKYVKVENGILEIHGFWNFKRLMVDIAYEIKGKEKCYYCKKRIYDSQVTIDHLFPEAYGGISVPNNLVPTCKRCNNEKADMNEQEYNEWRSIRDSLRRKEYYVKITQSKVARKFSSDIKRTFDVPEEWITYTSLSNIYSLEKKKIKTGKTYKKIYNFIKKYGKVPRILVVSKNNVLLDGKIVYDVCEDLELESIPVIILENVVAYE